MKKGNRKYIRLLATAMSLAVVGMLATFVALAAQPEPASAQGLCDGPLAPFLAQCAGRGAAADGPRHTDAADVADGCCRRRHCIRQHQWRRRSPIPGGD